MRYLIILAYLSVFPSVASSQTLELELADAPASSLAVEARDKGDARRGAILFHQVHVGCVKCHAVDGSSNSLGPDLTKLGEQKTASDDYVVASILKPSADIRKGYESVTVVTTDGRSTVGLLVSNDDTGLVLRDPARNGERVTIARDDIDEVVNSKLSIMPSGIVNQLGDRQQFLDLLRYVFELKDGGLVAARRLQPPPGTITLQLPEYEQRVDHAGLIASLNDKAFDRGEEIYNRLCINCHGNKEVAGSLPTALRFAEGRFRNGSDPYTMYKTLTHGFGLMVPQTWMVPQQKYDAVHYIRESYVKDANPGQYLEVTKDYLDSLPKGNTFGPEPIDYAPWSDMNYGPSMVNTFEFGSDGSNFAYKGIAVRLDAGPGGVSKGNAWAVFDHDTMRLAGAWTRTPNSKESGFINWQGIHFDGRHGTHPRVVGDVQFTNPTGPGWANPETGLFEDNQRVVGRDERRYGPLPRAWAKYRGLHTIGDQTIVEYTVAKTPILERLGHLELAEVDNETVQVFSRTMQLGERDQPLLALVATHPQESVSFVPLTDHSAAMLTDAEAAQAADSIDFNGATHLVVTDGSAFDMSTASFTITAKIRTTEGGTIFCKSNTDGPWVPDGKSFFVRDGKLCYDIGWVGAVQSKRKVNDGKWHDVALTWNQKNANATFYIDGKQNGGGKLAPKNAVTDHVVKIGYSAENFPAKSHFTGEMASVAFYQTERTVEEIQKAAEGKLQDSKVTAAWDLTGQLDNGIVSSSKSDKHAATVVRGTDIPGQSNIVAGIVGDCDGAKLVQQGNRICLSIPAGSSKRNMVVWTANVAGEQTAEQLKLLVARIEDQIKVDDLSDRIQQSSPLRWPEIVTTAQIIGADEGPFAVDVLSTPIANPWLARVRLTGHDFLADGDRVAVSSWDGDIWMVSGLKSLNTKDTAQTSDTQKSDMVPQLKWRRIASGLFQPLGVKVVADDIYVTCRDQLVILRDRNGDGETDFYECFNNDHQVTEHFHEFAMGLQQDEIGNFYYAKSARHALKALVPHHGTLLRIPSDGSRTEIVANGFRAANGVCLNPDGSFIVTDQEGHWNPKNRINWVREGGFYGNMFGYHDVTNEADDAMEQPLCWITNAFDRSPAELMWINNEAWGPLNGSLLNLSYGYGKVYIVPHENIGGQMQGGMCQLPIPQFPTGIARGRISPFDDGLYLSGMFAWGSSQQAQEGGFYRVRYTGRPSNMPIGLNASGKQLKVSFSDPLDAAQATRVDSYTIKVWSLQRSANYGSKHFDEHEIQVTGAELSADHKAVTLTIPELAKTWCMEISCRLKSADGEDFERVIHNTIHRTE